jgi:hypothetical protein
MREVNKMKNLIAFAIFALVLSVFASVAVSAEDNVVVLNQNNGDATETQINQEYPELAGDAGATPDQPIQYGLKTFGERLALGLTFNKEKRAQKELDIAQKRLLEMKKMIAKNKLQQAERLQAAYEERIQKASDLLAQIKENGNQATIVAGAKSLALLQGKVQNHEMAIEALKNVLAEKNLTDEQKAKLESVLERMENKTDDMKDKAEQRQEKIKDRLRAVTNKSESEVDAILNNATAEELQNVQQKLADRWINRTENALAKIDTKITEQKLKGINITELEGFTAEVEAKLADAKAAYAAGNYEDALEILKPVNNYGRQLSQVVKFRNEAGLQALKAERVKELAKIEVIKEKISENIASKIKSSLHAPETETENTSA